MSEENSQNTQRSENTQNTSIPQQQMDMNSLIRNLMESVVGVADHMPEKPNSRFSNNTTRACTREQECEDDCDDEEEEEDDEEEDEEDFFEVDDNFRWKTLGELVESHNRLTRAYLKMISRQN